jgi:hypothetical protein
MKISHCLLISLLVLSQYGCGGGSSNEEAPTPDKVTISDINADSAIKQPRMITDNRKAATGAFETYNFDTQTRARSESKIDTSHSADSDESFSIFLYMLGGAEVYEHLRLSLTPTEWASIHRINSILPREPAVALSLDGKYQPVLNPPVNLHPSTESDGTGCPQYFPKEDWGDSFQFGLNYMVLDVIGRPYFSRVISDKLLPPVRRQDGCQSKVGSWGLKTDDGGHLVASKLGGWGGRTNLVPQDGELNNSEWKRVENLVGRCMAAGYITLFQVYAIPPLRSTSLRPERFNASLSIGEIIWVGPFPIPVTRAIGQLQIQNEVPDDVMRSAVQGFIQEFSPYCG